MYPTAEITHPLARPSDREIMEKTYPEFAKVLDEAIPSTLRVRLPLGVIDLVVDITALAAFVCERCGDREASASLLRGLVASLSSIDAFKSRDGGSLQ